MPMDATMASPITQDQYEALRCIDRDGHLTNHSASDLQVPKLFYWLRSNDYIEFSGGRRRLTEAGRAALAAQMRTIGGAGG